MVKGATSFAKKLGIPTLIVGLTVVAFGTSVPELFVTTASTLKGVSEFALSDIIGSNIVNSLMILGVAIAIRPIKTSSKAIHRLLYSLTIFSLLFWIVSDRIFILKPNVIDIGFLEGLILLGAFSYFIFTHIRKVYLDNNEKQLTEEYERAEPGILSTAQSILEISIGVVALTFGAKFVVDNAVQICEMFNISKTYIGLTVLTLGTSLPELATVIVASLKDEGEIVLGNIIGSNIFNIAFILGISGLVGGISANGMMRVDIIFMILVGILLHYIADKKKIYSKVFGYQLIALYLTYFILISFRG